LQTVCRVVGWDIGGVNTKVAAVAAGRVMALRQQPYEIQRAPDVLVGLLRELSTAVAADADTAHAVTMTAELSQVFRTKREGVHFVLDALATALPQARAWVYTVDGRFLAPADARRDPLSVAAANWSATAHLVACHHPDAILVDIGTTTTDIIPIVGGQVTAIGHTDPERLASGELVYSGAVRTPAETMADAVPIGDALSGLSAEAFAVAGDVHVWRGDLTPADYTSPTPDGRPATRVFAGERLARVVCGDSEMLDEAAISSIADTLAAGQVAKITAAMRRVTARHPSLSLAVVTGLGAFIADRAARMAGLQVLPFSVDLGGAAQCAPAVSVALLLDEAIAVGTLPESRAVFAPGISKRPTLDTVVKLGGSLLAYAEHFDAALNAIAEIGRTRRVLVVPGGGPFADTVREVDRRLGLPDDAAHWMAVMAMDQYAQVVAARLPAAVVVDDPAEIAAAFNTGRVPVLAPSRWLRRTDPLPHSWDVTSDSIAAWVAGALGANRLVLVKPPGATGEQVVDRYFSRALPDHVSHMIVPVDQVRAVGL
jgi:probable H4MPT-linked C1 transfer pathway protein